ncbi:Protein TAPT1 like, partial [Pseudolycoriella hygida]
IDALFWTATEPKDRKRAHFGVFWHVFLALIYIILHSCLIMFQATTVNVAINSNNKGLLAIMMSNNFVELKGSVFKKFDKNNLFQLTCSDVRERVHLTVLLFVVVIQTMKEFNWKSEQFFVLLPDCIIVLLVEVLIDWIKHAFITRFNEIPADVYTEYTISLAYDMTQTRQKHAFSDHSDLVARRMGFIPFPLGVVLIKALYTAVSFDNAASIILFIIAYLTLVSCRILNTICALGKACDLMQKHQDEKNQNSTPTGHTNQNFSINGIGTLAPTPAKSQQRQLHFSATTDTSTSPIHLFQPLQRSRTVEIVVNDSKNNLHASSLLHDPSFGATALFSNSDVDLDDICLNEKVLNINQDDVFEDMPLARSVPDLQQQDDGTGDGVECTSSRRTHKRSESDPFIQSIYVESGSERT